MDKKESARAIEKQAQSRSKKMQCHVLHKTFYFLNARIVLCKAKNISFFNVVHSMGRLLSQPHSMLYKSHIAHHTVNNGVIISTNQRNSKNYEKLPYLH